MTVLEMWKDFKIKTLESNFRKKMLSCLEKTLSASVFIRKSTLYARIKNAILLEIIRAEEDYQNESPTISD